MIICNWETEKEVNIHSSSLIPLGLTSTTDHTLHTAPWTWWILSCPHSVWWSGRNGRVAGPTSVQSLWVTRAQRFLTRHPTFSWRLRGMREVQPGWCPCWYIGLDLVSSTSISSTLREQHPTYTPHRHPTNNRWSLPCYLLSIMHMAPHPYFYINVWPWSWMMGSDRHCGLKGDQKLL